jgi:hypothetical protein
MLPFLLVAILAHLDKIRDRALFVLSLGQTAVFILLVAFRAPWVLNSTDYLRYFFLIALLLGVALIATSLKRRGVLLILAILSLIFFAKTLYLLAIPTTYNNALNWVTTHIATEPVVVTNNVSVLDLPLNAPSYALLKDGLCASRCEEEITDTTSPYKYTVIAGDSDPAKIKSLPKQTQYVISSTSLTNAGTLVESFENNPNADDYFATNHQLGLYNLQFLMLPRFGENIYIYRNI